MFFAIDGLTVGIGIDDRVTQLQNWLSIIEGKIEIAFGLIDDLIKRSVDEIVDRRIVEIVEHRHWIVEHKYIDGFAAPYVDLPFVEDNRTIEEILNVHLEKIMRRIVIVNPISDPSVACGGNAACIIDIGTALHVIALNEIYAVVCSVAAEINIIVPDAEIDNAARIARYQSIIAGAAAQRVVVALVGNEDRSVIIII